MFPPAPELGVLRLATLADIPRIAVVAASGFYHSSWFHYERPYYEKFPLDTLASYRNSYRNAISNKNAIVLVAEDTLNRSEKDSVYGALAESYPSFEEQIPDEHLKAGKAIVAVASFSLLPDSQRSGQFQPKDPEHYDPPDDPQDRDKDPLASDLMDKTLHPRETE
ncbi:hypothetical protein DIS24_g5386 [Lasiodiplodia hormozganensis]|uniref:Uncharacterized protein n=1 Tax=Lasiodiplodia hormozganensis TaxID=869390 RepID=A0AA39YKF0_9PEZI|nr:hypothetical protein DIS24_g5386 [Lasiodiplodia hormozganensis]